jgi:hypothetical protein
LIWSRDAGSAINDKEDEYRRFDRDLCLLENALRDFAFFAGDDAAGVDNFVGTSMPTHNSVYPIASDAGFIGDNRATLTNKTIEESRFANVWTANDSNQRQTGRHESLRDGTSLSFSKIAHQMMMDLNCLKVVYIKTIVIRGFENQ